MITQAEDVAVVSAFPFEDGARIVQPVRKDMQLRIAPRDQRAIPPDEAVSVIERNERH